MSGSSYVPIAQRTMPRPPARPGNRNTWLAWIAGVLALLLIGTGLYFFFWKTGESRFTGSCGVVVDGSGSSNSSNGFNAPKYIDKYVDNFLFETRCRYVAFAPIDTSSVASRCTNQVVDLDPDEIHDGRIDANRARKEYRGNAVTAAKNIYTCIQHEPTRNSDVLGGLIAISQVRPDPIGSYTVLVVSDFGEATKGLTIYTPKLSTPSGRKGLIDQINNDHIMPDLNGIDVRTAGYNVQFTKDAAMSAAFDSFWREVILTHAHAKSFSRFDK